MKNKSLLSMIMLLVTLFSIFTGFSSNVFAAKNSSSKIYAEIKKYINNSSSEIKFKDNEYLSGLEGLDTKSYDLFLTGESHATKKNYDLRFAFLKYLNQNANVRYHIEECDYSTSYFINEYLKTGNEKILRYCHYCLEGSYAGNNEGYEFWKKVYEYNKTLPDEKKIIVLGMDIGFETSVDALTIIVRKRNKVMPDEIKDALHKLYEAFINPKYSSMKDVISLLNQDIDSKRELYKEFLEDDFEDFERIVKNTAFSINYADTDDGNIWNNQRENFMYKNFIELSKRFNDGKYFGQLGCNHVFQDCYDVNSLANRIKNSDSSFNNKVCSIVYLYINSYYMNKENGHPEQTPNLFYGLDEALNKVKMNNNISCKLLGPNTSYKKNCFDAQYALLVSDSQACTRLCVNSSNS